MHKLFEIYFYIIERQKNQEFLFLSNQIESYDTIQFMHKYFFFKKLYMYEQILGNQ